MVGYKYLVLSVFLFVGCTHKNLTTSAKQVVLTIKSPKIKYNDVALMKHNQSSIQINGFFAGTNLFKLSISKNICINKTCLTPSLFNSHFLSDRYENTILQNILNKKPIFNAKKMIKTKNGFTQNIHNKYYKISYKVNVNSMYFKDTVNKILIKLKDNNI